MAWAWSPRLPLPVPSHGDEVDEAAGWSGWDYWASSRRAAGLCSEGKHTTATSVVSQSEEVAECGRPTGTWRSSSAVDLPGVSSREVRTNGYPVDLEQHRAEGSLENSATWGTSPRPRPHRRPLSISYRR
jgi:hypothetical protein